MTARKDVFHDDEKGEKWGVFHDGVSENGRAFHGNMI
jgi:hypothetical protein